MYEVPFGKLLQPRVSATCAYNGKDTAFVSYASSTRWPARCRARPSWDRNLATTIQAYFDANGNLFADDPLALSSGKLFVQNMTPPTHNEWLIGTARSSAPPDGARLLPLQPRQPLLGRHQQHGACAGAAASTRRDAAGHRRGIPEDALHPNLTDMRRRSAVRRPRRADRPT
jgi:hypothetical protein